MNIKLILFALSLSTALSVSVLADEITPPILDINAINTTVNPCQDFYKYACGKWQNTFQLPAEKSIYYRQSSGLEDQADETLNGVLKRYASGDFTTPTQSAPQLAALYSSCMDEKKISQESLLTVKNMIGKLNAIKTPQDLARSVAQLHLMGVNILFNFSSGQDLNDSTRIIGFSDEGGLSLPDQSYYFGTDAKSLDIISHYKKHVTKMLVLYGFTQAEAASRAAIIFNLEKQLASHAMKLADRQDSSKTNHPSDRQGLKKMTPNFDWDDYFVSLGVNQVNALNINEPDFYTGLNGILKTVPLQNLKIYMAWQILSRFATSMDNKFDQEYFSFWNNYLSGTKTENPRWKRCTQAVENSMTDALAQAYVSLLSADAINAKTKTMLGQIISIFSGDLQTLSWLDDSTRAAALAKLAKVGSKIGYPDKWRSYQGLQLGTNFVANDASQSIFNSHYSLNKIGQPVNKSEWGMPPWEADAYYDPSRNELVLPIGELIPPVLDLGASDGANFGSLGATTIGHELTHGFDSNGSQFDGNGNFKDWWSPPVRAEFQKRTQCLVNQANQYQVELTSPGGPSGDLHVDGQLTLTENLADQGGMKLALEAFSKIAATRAPAPEWQGYNEVQQYFIAFAQAWCSKVTDEKRRLSLKTDVHPPEEFRVNGVLFNRPEFTEAFGCKTGAPMAPATRCAVW